MNKDFSEFSIDRLMNITARPSLVFEKGAGSWLWDNEGCKYLDFVQGWAVNCLGHSPAVIRDALCEQAAKLISPSPAFYNEPAICLAGLLTDNSCFDQVFFANSGAEANEGAIKLARKWGELHRDGAYEIITFVDGFHGRTLATMSASGKAQFAELFEPKVAGFPKAQLNDIDSVRALIGKKTVAVMLEPIQGEAGVLISDDDFLGELRALTAAHGILLIVDEIQTGVGRTGRLWGHQYAGIEPDIMTLGKMLGGGVPLAALLAREEVCCFAHGDQGGTFNGNPLMTAVGAAVLKNVLADGFLDAVNARGRYLQERLQEVSRRHELGPVRGRGLLVALVLGVDSGPKIVEAARKRGLLLNAPRPGLLRFMPALTVTEEEIDQMVSMLDECLVCS